jgi:hypothetical protein
MAIWKEHCTVDTSLSASDATLQIAIFHPTASRGGRFWPISASRILASRKACVFTLLLLGQNRSRPTRNHSGRYAQKFSFESV